MQPLQLVDLVLLALVEGVADVLPIDSTAHALLASWLLHWRAGAIDISIHLGTALALLLYLWRDIVLIGRGLWRLKRRRFEPGAKLLAKAIIAALPWIVVTVLLGRNTIIAFSDLRVVGIITLVCAILMIVAERMSMTVNRIEHIAAPGIVALGVLQLLALIPGVGRVAALAVGARLLGLERLSAFRFVLLVQIPILLASAISQGFVYSFQGIRPSQGDILAGGITFLFVLAAVSFGLKWLLRFGLIPFALYRLLLGAVLVGLTFL